jgi:hypothetical protein
VREQVESNEIYGAGESSKTPCARQSIGGSRVQNMERTARSRDRLQQGRGDLDLALPCEGHGMMPSGILCDPPPGEAGVSAGVSGSSQNVQHAWRTDLAAAP